MTRVTLIVISFNFTISLNLLNFTNLQKHCRTKRLAIGSCGSWEMALDEDERPAIYFVDFSCDNSPHIKKHNLLFRVQCAYDDGRSVT